MTPSPPRRHYPACTSTSDLAKTWLCQAGDDAAPHGAFVTADYQTAGRGRRGRTWSAPPGQNLLLSVILRPSGPIALSWRIAFSAAVAAANALEEIGFSPLLKWPNDLLIEGHKIAGILVETTIVGPERQWGAIVGVGVNVNQDQFGPPEFYAVPPTSLIAVDGTTRDVGALASRMAERVVEWDEVREADWPAVVAAWRDRMASRLFLRRGGEVGLGVELQPDGAMLVQLQDGTLSHWSTVEAEDSPL